ncbi:hypothetical protein GGH19_001173 [Coemansia sp. RSA 1807]|nr:hypothetical protein EV180_005959 [Coemansia sp. RSA 518]KAJ2409403.1 hypothetical protein J3F80_001326 [Coemansia sp. RSA 2526]KAJ2446917.1 hypothetical protein IWW46_000632 [Coemansia sp. RSA 2440]KAJ2577635.1 hypothetical protein GGH19_001173 [Coemansia sp. RSA 1807]
MEGVEAKAVGVHIDRVTQLQDSVDEQCKMLFSSLHYLHKRAGMVQVSSDIPVTQQNSNAESSDDFSQRTQEIATDICRQAKKIDTLAESLPGTTNAIGELEKDFQELNRENEQVTVELQEANRQARELLDSLSAMLTAIADNFGSSTT